MKVINRALAFREEQENLFRKNGETDLGNYTTLNITLLKGGVQNNVVPKSVLAGFDIRISPLFGVEKFEKLFNEWIDIDGY